MTDHAYSRMRKNCHVQLHCAVVKMEDRGDIALAESPISFKTGNISVCSGCRNNFSSTNEIVVRHAEYRTFNNPRTGRPNSKYSNAYYHAKQHCLGLRWGEFFQPNSVVVNNAIRPLLTFSHKQVILQEFGVVV